MVVEVDLMLNSNLIKLQEQTYCSYYSIIAMPFGDHYNSNPKYLRQSWRQKYWPENLKNEINLLNRDYYIMKWSSSFIETFFFVKLKKNLTCAKRLAVVTAGFGMGLLNVAEKAEELDELLSLEEVL